MTARPQNKQRNFSSPPLLRPKFNNGLGLLSLCALGYLFAWLLTKDLLLGVALFAVVVGICLVIFCFLYVEFGYYLMLFTGFFGNFFSNWLTDGKLPVGIIFDCIVLVNFLGLAFSRKDFKTNWNRFSSNPLVLVMFVSFFYCILEMVNPISMGASASNLLGVRKFLEYILLLFTAYMLFDNFQAIRRFIFALLLTATGCAIYGCIQQWHGLFNWEIAPIMADPHRYALLFVGGDFKKFSTLSDPASFGIMMAVCALFYIILTIYEKSVWTKLLFISCCIFMILGMAYSGTRTAYAVILAGFVFFVLFNIDNSAVRRFGIFLLLIFLVLMFGPFSGNATIFRFRTTFFGEKNESFKVRLVSRDFIKPFIQHHPMGAGMGTTGFNGAIEHPGNPVANFQPDGAYVMRAAETGWIGLLINVVLYFLILRAGITAFFRIKDPRIKVYYAAGVSAIFAFYVGDYAQLAVGQIDDVGLYFGIIAMILRHPQYSKTYEENRLTA